MKNKPKFSLIEVVEITGLEHSILLTWIEREWIIPPNEQLLDEEDIARIQLIHDLQLNFGVNDEAVPLILHLIDQLCHFRNKVEQFGE